MNKDFLKGGWFVLAALVGVIWLTGEPATFRALIGAGIGLILVAGLDAVLAKRKSLRPDRDLSETR